MFEQQAFEAVPPRAPQYQPQYAMAPQQPVRQPQPQQVQQPQGGALRGTVYNDAFIPPAPMEAGYETSYGPELGLSPLAAKKPPYQAELPVQSTTTPGLALKPPVPGGGVSRKKAPTLFERFTSPLRPHNHRDEEKQGDSSSGQASSGGGAAPSLRAPQREMQGSLNIDAPRVTESEEELDIPAFLRRQAN